MSSSPRSSPPPAVGLPPALPVGWGYRVLVGLAVGAVLLAGAAYLGGPGATYPALLPAQLLPVTLTTDTFEVGALAVAVPASGFIVGLTHDVGGPLVLPWAAGVWLGLLAVVLAGWLAVVSTLGRTPFVVGTVPVIFFLLSLQADTLGVFRADKPYFLVLALAVLGGAAFGLHAFGERVPLAGRWALLGALVAGLSALLFGRSTLAVPETALQLAAYAVPGGAVLFALFVLWIGLENVRALLWFNGQAPLAAGRYGPTPFLLATGLYLSALLAYVVNGELRLWPGLALDPLVLLLPAALAGGLGLRLRAPSYQGWVPFGAARQLYALLTAAAAAALAYALVTQNSPLLDAARAYAALALLLTGAVFGVYVLLNFLPLLRQRLQVFRVVFAPRRLPFYTVYVLAVGGLVVEQLRQGNPLPGRMQAGQFNLLGDLTRAQAEARPDDLPLALLAERYYAESGDVLDRHNAHAQLGRAALYRFRQQRRNEVIALRRALRRQPDPQIALRLAALLNDPADLFEALDVLRQARRDASRSAPLAATLAQRFTQTSLADSVAFYLDRAESLAPGTYPNRTNQLAFLLRQRLYPAAVALAASLETSPRQPALLANLTLLRLLQAAAADSVARRAALAAPRPVGAAAVPKPAPAAPEANLTAFTPNDFAATPPNLDAATFAAVYHAALANARRHDAALLPLLLALSQRPANEAYYEQLLFLQALTRHATGQEMAARQTLAPLAAGSSATAHYYQYILALWQLQQGQYATAATQLALAANPDSTVLQAVRQLLREAAGAAPLPTPARPPVGTAWLAQAQAAEKQPAQKEAAARLYRRIVQEAPFNETALLAAAAYHTRRRDHLAAYEALNRGLAENPASPALLRAYVLAATDAGLPAYAAQTLPRLQPLLTPAAFAALRQELATHQAARATAFD